MYLMKSLGLDVVNIPKINGRIEPIVFGGQELYACEGEGIGKKTLG